MVARWIRPERAVLAAALLALAACSVEDEEYGSNLTGAGPPGAQAARQESIEVPPPPFSEGIFPCSECHNKDLPPKLERRKLSMAHTDIVFEHDAEHRWCLDCHDANERDHLHLAGGQPVPFEESYRLCGQCHGDKLRDWRVGVHGRRTGNWDGHKKYLLCVNCHNAHSPRFKPIEPLPPPPAPERTR